MCEGQTQKNVNKYFILQVYYFYDLTFILRESKSIELQFLGVFSITEIILSFSVLQRLFLWCFSAPCWLVGKVVFYLLLAALAVLLSILRFTQQVWEGQRLQRAGSRRPGIPEGVRFLGVPPAPD